MKQFIIVLLSMVIILTFTKFLINETEKNNSQDITLNFDNNKIKCKCNLNKSNEILKENFSNFKKEFVPIKPEKNENIITSIENLNKPKHSNITAELYYKNKFIYPIEPLKINSFEVYPSNQYEYINIGNDTDKLNNI